MKIYESYKSILNLRTVVLSILLSILGNTQMLAAAAAKDDTDALSAGFVGAPAAGAGAHPDHFEAMRLLWRSLNGAERDMGHLGLMAMAADPKHEQNYRALRALWYSSVSADKDAVRPALMAIASNPADFRNGETIGMFSNSGIPADHDFVRPILGEIASNLDHPQNWATIFCCLWISGRPADRDAASPGLRAIAADATHPKNWEAIDLLWNSSVAADKAVVRSHIQRVFADGLGTDGIKLRYIARLRESNDAQDQALGLALKLKYYPVVLAPAIKARMDVFNQDRIKAAAPKSLPDLSGRTDIDMVARFNTLMDQINTTDTASPAYLHVGAIDENMTDEPYHPQRRYVPDADNTAAMADIKNKVRGFLKTLAGQPLAAGEPGGWEMYEDNKPGMINALKNLTLALESNMATDVPTALNNLGVLIRGLLYCPTGQNEGIASAVNAVIHGQNVMASDLAQKMDVVMYSAVDKAFNSAFHAGGDVHGLARARMIFTPHIGVGEGIAGFKERISRLGDAEIPGLFNDFYGRFTKENIIAEFKRNIWSAEEYAHPAKRKALELGRAPLAAKRGALQREIEDDALESGLLSFTQRDALSPQLGAIAQDVAPLDVAMAKLVQDISALDRRHKHAKQERPITIGEIADWLYAQDKEVNDMDAGDYGFKDYGINSDRTAISDEGIWKLLQDIGYIKVPVESAAAGAGGAPAAGGAGAWGGGYRVLPGN